MIKGENLEGVIKKYSYRQPEPDMCWGAAIKFILDELSDRHNNQGLKISLKKINDICDYKPGQGLHPDITTPALNNYFEKKKLNYIMNEIEGSDNWSKLQEILKDEKCSYPLVCMHQTYFKEINDRYEVPGNPNWEHVIVVLKINEEVSIYDPFEAYLLKSSNVKQPPKTIRKPSFITHWAHALSPYGLMWIEKTAGKRKKSKKRRRLINESTLEKYGLKFMVYGREDEEK